MILLVDSKGPDESAQDDLDLRCLRTYMPAWCGLIYTVFNIFGVKRNLLLYFFSFLLLQTDFDDGHCPSWSNQLTALYNVNSAAYNTLAGTHVYMYQVRVRDPNLRVCARVRARVCVSFYVYSFSKNFTRVAMSENVPSDMCAQQRFRSACAFTLSD